MKKKTMVALLAFASTFTSASALTLEGVVEKSEPAKKRSFWQRLFGPEPEGRIGVRISRSGYIGYVHPGSPAEKVGLQEKDCVLAVDGRKHAIDDISGDPGTSVHLEIKRHSESFLVDVPRVSCHEIQY